MNSSVFSENPLLSFSSIAADLQILFPVRPCPPASVYFLHNQIALVIRGLGRSPAAVWDL